MKDFGYDVSDYCDVDPVFGTLADLDRVIAAAHGHGLRVLLDWVPNHTSDRHPWFLESRASRTSPKRKASRPTGASRRRRSRPQASSPATQSQSPVKAAPDRFD